MAEGAAEEDEAADELAAAAPAAGAAVPTDAADSVLATFLGRPRERATAAAAIVDAGAATVG